MNLSQVSFPAASPATAAPSFGAGRSDAAAPARFRDGLMARMGDDRPEPATPRATAPEKAARPVKPDDVEESAAQDTRFSGKSAFAKATPEAAEKLDDNEAAKIGDDSPVTTPALSGGSAEAQDQTGVPDAGSVSANEGAEGQAGKTLADDPAKDSLQAPKAPLAAAEPAGKTGGPSDRFGPEKPTETAGIERKSPAQSTQITVEAQSTRPSAVATAGSTPAAVAPAPAEPNAPPNVLAVEPAGRAGSVSGTAPAAPLVQMQRADWPQTVVSATLSALTPDGGTMTLDLAPQELGALRVTLVLEGDRASVSIQTETPEAARALNEAQRELAQDFARHGVTLSAHDAQTGGRGTPRNGLAPSSDTAGDDPQSDPAGLMPAQGILNLIA